MSTSAPARVEISGVPGIPQVRPGDDLVVLLAAALRDDPPADGDVVVVTSKIVSKAEGRVRAGVDRDDAIDDEAVRTVSEWTTPHGRTRIVETRHGFVMAAAGVDASNVESGSIVLLPVDPDASARSIRAGLAHEFGVRLGVVITDTAGRTWRNGVVDVAVGTAGVRALDDLRGRQDRYGNDLGVTVVAVADELAAASELVRSKLADVPVAVVRGLGHLVLEPDADDTGSRGLVRPIAEDRFRLGTPEAMRAGVTARPLARRFDERAVDGGMVHAALTAARTVPTHGRDDIRFVVAESVAARTAVVDATGRDPDVLRSAACVVLACLDAPPSIQDGPDAEPGSDGLLALGAAVERLAVVVGADGVATAWVPFGSASPQPAKALGRSLGLPDGWQIHGAVALGYAAPALPQVPPPDVDDAVIVR